MALSVEKTKGVSMTSISRSFLFLALLVILICLAAFSTNKNTNHNSCYFGNYRIDDVLVNPVAFSPVPAARDSFWKKEIPVHICQKYIKLGEKYLGKEWNPLPVSLFADYRKTGNRKNYEMPYFEKRRQMSCLVMAEIMEHKGTFLKDIDKGLNYFISEVWWGIPAAYPTDYPDEGNQKIDLFNPETANLLAWTIYMLHDELESVDKGICNKIVKEIQRRVLKPARENGYYWSKSLDNWNTWICSNLLSCVLFCETDRKKQVGDIKRIIDSLNYFITNYHEDGGCEEGIMYWDRAGASLYECIYLLDLATNHTISMRNDVKLKAIGSYVYKMYIGNRNSVNFADAHPITGVHINILYPFGKYLNDSIMMKQAAFIAENQGFFKSPASSFMGSGNFPTLSRELMFLTYFDSFSRTIASEPLIRDSEFKDLQIVTARSYDNSSTGLFFAVKGGNNNEYHNHNDVGNFIIYKDAEPLFIDIGAGTYTEKTFSDKRYDLFNCRSAYHNVPVINGVEQKNGKEFRGRNYKYVNTSSYAQYSLDISRAYPKVACVEEWNRTITLERGKEIFITEDYRLGRFINPSEITLICCGNANIIGDSVIVDNGKNNGVLYFDRNQLTPVIEKIVYQDKTIYDVWNKKDLCRIKLVVNNRNLKGTIRYCIR